MKRFIFYLLAMIFIIIVGCQKEYSFENGNAPGSGSLQSDVSGDCLPKTVNGIYEVNTPLVPSDNTIAVDVDVTETGTYFITTDTVNGFYFSATGTFTSLGINTVNLRSNGTPFAEGVFNFVVTYDTTSCDVQVTVLPEGGAGPADFTLDGSPANCAGATVMGTYIFNSPLNASNKVTLNVNVTTIGTYSVSTSFQGMNFAGTGVFSSTGPATITLQGSGTPANGGTNTVPVTAGSSSCSFDVEVEIGAEGTLGGGPGDCTPAIINGTYTQGTALDPATNTVQIEVSITSGGVYSIATNTVAGMSFSSSGTLNVGANQVIILEGTGSPTATGVQTFTVTFGSSTCTFDVDIMGGSASIDWKFTEGATTYQGTIDNASLTVPVAPFTLLSASGSDAGGNSLIFSLADISGGINNGENYATSSTTSNNVSFLFFDGSANTLYKADASISGLNFKATVTNHNTTTKTITGTFSGTVKNGADVTKTISGGTFTITYP